MTAPAHYPCDPALDRLAGDDSAAEAALIECCHTGWAQTPGPLGEALAILGGVKTAAHPTAAEHAEARSILRQLLSDPCCDHLSAVTVGRARKLMGDG